jgi:hypothetical protein
VKLILASLIGGALIFGTVLARADDKPPAIDLSEFATGVAILVPSKHAVSNATIVNGVVRVTSKSTAEASVLVARHFYPFDNGKCSASTTTKRPCVGGMIGLGLGSSAAGSNQLINFIGAGLTVGSPSTDNTTTAWQFGIGIGRRFNYQVLGDGFVENAAPPVGETQVRYKTIDVNAPFAFFTVHW